MQKRNEYMVDLADKVIAVWDGSKVEQQIVSNMLRRLVKKLSELNHRTENI